MFAVVPTLLTLGNAVCGFGSITFATKVGPGVTEGNELLVAALLLLAAMVFDMLDGHAARWAKMTSDFGAQLDSLCDVISFGVAPAFIMLKFPQVHHLYHPRAALGDRPACTCSAPCCGWRGSTWRRARKTPTTRSAGCLRRRRRGPWPRW